jgi:hypothetical protein
MKRSIIFVLLFNTMLLFPKDYKPQKMQENLLKEDFETRLEIYGRFSRYIFLTKNNLKIFNKEYSNDEENYVINWEVINKINYISFNYTGKTLGPSVANGNKRYLIIFDLFGIADKYYLSSFIGFYDHINELIFYMSKFNIANNWYNNAGSIKTTSELIENQIKYSSDNLLNIERLFPWVEGLSGDGKGIEIVQTFSYNCTGEGNLMLINGFIDYNRPYLFEQNNRIKALKITWGDEIIYCNIDDTSLFQNIYLERENRWEDDETDGKIIKEIIFKITDIYSGTKYNDTCINYLLFNEDRR